MDLAELFLIAVGLSMDAFAAAVCKGLAMKRIRWGQAGAIALSFGGFQALMPALGWALGRQCEGYISRVDHWIAFLLLGYIGGRMIWDALRGGEEGEVREGLGLRELLALSAATSVDALAVGITFAFLRVDVLPAAALIGCTTFTLSLAGVCAGQRFGARYKDRAALAGGAILCLMGLKLLFEHLWAPG